MACYFKRCYFYWFFLIVYFISQIFFLCFLKLFNQDSHANSFKILEIYKKLAIKINKEAELDNSGLYKIIVAKKFETLIPQDITIISQCSSNHFSSVESLFNAWKGPISVAIYTEVENIEKSLWDMAKFIQCNHLRDFAMQLVVPFQGKFTLKDTYIRDLKFAYNLLSETDKSVACDSSFYMAQNGQKNYDWKSSYPINLLRNVAKARSVTDHILVVDIDMVPNLSLRNDFLNFLKKKKPEFEKIVYVVPAFEIVPDAVPPGDKTQLLRMVENLEARPFYVAACEECQKFTKYNKWLKSDNVMGLDVLYEVDWKHPWEPFFIAKRDVPNFDERFKQYGMNRVSQICELHVAGYKFLILENAFLIHKGFKMEEDFHKTKEKEMEMNRRVYARFKIEVLYKYPQNGRRC